MEIYKRGQGIWARGLAVVLFLLFFGWGVVVLYGIPSDLSVIVRPGDVIWPERARDLLESGKSPVLVRGLPNQPVSEALLAPGLKPASRIEDRTGHGIVLEGETFDKDKLKALEEAGITHVPVLQGEVLLDTVKVDDWLEGRVLAQEISVQEQLDLPGKRGDVLDEALVNKIREIMQPHPNQLIGVFYRTPEDLESGQNPIQVMAKDLQQGWICSGPLSASFRRLVAAQGSGISAEILAALKRLDAAGKIPGGKVRIQDEGPLRLDGGNLDAIGGRYLISNRNVMVDTWWSTVLFRVPLVNLGVSWGVLICLVLFIVGSLAVLYTWNLARWNDLLIETQTEMKKVSWPKREELIGSSLVVIVSVLVLGMYLYVVDIVLTALADQTGLLR